MKVAIIGGGIGGLTTALAFKKYRPEIEIEIYESSIELKPIGAGLILAANAVMAFDQLGIKEKNLKAGNILEKIQIKDRKGRLLTEENNLAIHEHSNIVYNFSIHRADLQRILLDELGDIKLNLNKTATTFTKKDSKVYVQFSDDTIIEANFIIATDGIHSVFRKSLIPTSSIRFAGYTCWRGVTTHLPSNFNFSTASETWGEGNRFGIVPLSDNRIYWFACIRSKKKNNQVFAAFTKTQLAASFKNFHSPIVELIHSTSDRSILWNDIIDLKPINQFAFTTILLLGDAAHATTPNIGQGACQAIEGAVILGKIIQKISNIEDAFKLFEKKRLKRVHSIVRRSWLIGKIAHLKNPILATIRNLSMNLLFAKISKKQINKIIHVNFDSF